MEAKELTYQEQIDKQSCEYDKSQLFEAFNVEHAARKRLNESLTQMTRKYAAMMYDRDMYQEKYLRMHIAQNVHIVGDMEEMLDYFFNHRDRQVLMTKSGGYLLTTEEENCTFIIACWVNPKKLSQERKEMPEILRAICQTSMRCIRYRGVHNVLKNHSIDVGGGIYEIRL